LTKLLSAQLTSCKFGVDADIDGSLFQLIPGVEVLGNVPILLNFGLKIRV
jgi:hypothetical protein